MATIKVSHAEYAELLDGLPRVVDTFEAFHRFFPHLGESLCRSYYDSEEPKLGIGALPLLVRGFASCLLWDTGNRSLGFFEGLDGHPGKFPTIRHHAAWRAEYADRSWPAQLIDEGSIACSLMFELVGVAEDPVKYAQVTMPVPLSTYWTSVAFGDFESNIERVVRGNAALREIHKTQVDRTVVVACVECGGWIDGDDCQCCGAKSFSGIRQNFCQWPYPLPRKVYEFFEFHGHEFKLTYAELEAKRRARSVQQLATGVINEMKKTATVAIDRYPDPKLRAAVWAALPYLAVNVAVAPPKYEPLRTRSLDFLETEPST